MGQLHSDHWSHLNERVLAVEASLVASGALQGLKVQMRQAAHQPLQLIKSEQAERIAATHLRGECASSSGMAHLQPTLLVHKLCVTVSLL